MHYFYKDIHKDPQNYQNKLYTIFFYKKIVQRTRRNIIIYFTRLKEIQLFVSTLLYTQEQNISHSVMSPSLSVSFHCSVSADIR